MCFSMRFCRESFVLVGCLNKGEGGTSEMIVLVLKDPKARGFWVGPVGDGFIARLLFFTRWLSAHGGFWPPGFI